MTLTYENHHLPSGKSLVPEHLRDFLKRLRRMFPAKSVRYFGVGEYGDKNQRPHYHLALFGLPSCRRGRTEHRPDRLRGKACCPVCDLYQRKWSKGSIDSFPLDVGSAKYIAGYVTKKLSGTSPEIMEQLHGRHQEFARMSLKPGIGHAGAVSMGEEFQKVQEKRDRADLTPLEVPTCLKFKGANLPIGRYLKKVVYSHAGVSETEEVQKAIDRYSEEMLPVLLAGLQSPGNDSVQLKKIVLENFQQKRLSTVKKYKMYEKPRSL